MKSFNTFQIMLALLFLPMFSRAQVVQEGSVVEMNSGSKPIAGVAVTLVGAIPADSDGSGRFRLVFSGTKPGSRAVVGRIYKAGYEIVNDTELKNWVLSEKVPFKIVMCHTGLLEQSRRKFYDIGRDRYYTLYYEASKKLRANQQKNIFNEQQLADSLQAIQTMYEDNMRRLDYYADKFSRINKDELGELDARALELMEQGLVEQAIAVYEDAAILRVFRDRTAMVDSLSSDISALTAALANQVRLLISAGIPTSYVQADSLIRVMQAYNPNTPGLTSTISELHLSMGEFQKVYDLIANTLPACHDTTAGERLADLLIRAAGGLEARYPEEEWLAKAKALIKEWHDSRALKMFPPTH